MHHSGQVSTAEDDDRSQHLLSLIFTQNWDMESIGWDCRTPYPAHLDPEGPLRIGTHGNQGSASVFSSWHLPKPSQTCLLLAVSMDPKARPGNKKPRKHVSLTPIPYSLGSQYLATACYLDTSGREGTLAFSELSFPSPRAFCGWDEKEVEGKSGNFSAFSPTLSGPVHGFLKDIKDWPIMLATPLIGVYLWALSWICLL